MAGREPKPAGSDLPAAPKPSLLQAVRAIDDSVVRNILDVHLKKLAKADFSEMRTLADLSDYMWKHYMLILFVLPSNPHLKFSLDLGLKNLKMVGDTWRDYLEIQFPAHVKEVVEQELARNEMALKEALPPEQWQMYQRCLSEQTSETIE